MTTYTKKIWISPSMTRNYLLQDPILDYFKEVKHGNTGKPHAFSFQSFIMEQGNKFELEIMKNLNLKFNEEIKTFTKPNNDIEFANAYSDTIRAINNKTPIIYQGVLIDEAKFLRGIPDLIVRKDYLPKLFSNFQLSELKNEYYIVDIKFSTLHLCANGNSILNSGSVPAYKGQLYLYTKMLNGILFNKNSSDNKTGYDNMAFILGKRYEYESKGIKYSENSPFAKAGIIDYNNCDKKYIDLTESAVSWLIDVKMYAKTWQLLPIPSRPELYPNMSNTYDYPWHDEKVNLANALAEITSLWYCGIKERKISHEKGIMSWRDKNLTAEIMGIKGIRVNIINQMIHINRDDTSINMVFPEKMVNDKGKWRTCPNNNVEIFIDFETINTDIISVNGERSNYIFLIGAGWDNEKYSIEPFSRKRKYTPDTWKCKHFLMEKLDNESEIRMINDFMNWITSIENKFAKPVRLYHWSNAEKYQMEFVFSKHKFAGIDLITKKLFDLKDIFIEEPIIIKGCFGYGLKEIAKKLYSIGAINTTWCEKNTCPDGMTAMILAKKSYDENDTASQIMKDIKEYNEIDCKVLYEILNFLRNKNTADTELIQPRRSDRIREKTELITKEEFIQEKTELISNNKRRNGEKNYDLITDDENNDNDDNYEPTESDEDENNYEPTESDDDEPEEKYSKVEIELATFADDKTYEDIIEYLQPINVSTILASNASLKNKIRAIALYNTSLTVDQHTTDYTSLMTDIKLLIGNANVLEYDHIIYDETEANLSKAAKKVVDSMRQKALKQKVSITDILNSKLHESKKIKALEMYDIRNRLGVMHDEFIPRDEMIRRYITNPKNYEEDISVLDKIERINADKQTKNTMISWHIELETHGSESESGRVLENKLSTSLKIPFNISHIINYDNGFAEWIWEYKQKLDSRLYGMERVKTQLIQCLVNQHTNPAMSQQVIALSGSPGIGKTAICQAHAFASGIPITFCNVGAITDSTFFKGSNGVYIGAEPGNIVKSLISMGVDNGIIVLDEIDKIIMENERSKGVYTTLLEIIDPSQNKSFTDEFLPKITIDLSKIRFFCTMNDHTLIDPILLDRIKVIHIDPYLEEDKINIVRRHFINTISNNYGFTEPIVISDNAIKLAIDSTKNMGTTGTIEKGVRFLKQLIEDAISWMNTVKTLYTGDKEKFMSLIGDNYKNYPIKFNNEITIELIMSVANNLAGKKEKISHPHMYL